MAVSKPTGADVDVLIVGAGISGIGAACRLQERCPGKRWTILEARNRVGGTWDLFRYPGVRSDSDMYTLGFPFRPWRSDVAIVSGHAIRDYIEDTAREFGILDKIRFGHRVTRASWSSKHARSTVEAEQGTFTCSFLYLGSGYYDYRSEDLHSAASRRPHHVTVHRVQLRLHPPRPCQTPAAGQPPPVAA